MSYRRLASRPERGWGDPTELELFDVLEQAVKDWFFSHDYGCQHRGEAWAPSWLSTLMERLPTLRAVSKAVGNRTLDYRQAYRCIDKVLDERDPLEAFSRLLDELPSQAWG